MTLEQANTLWRSMSKANRALILVYYGWEDSYITGTSVLTSSQKRDLLEAFAIHLLLEFRDKPA